MSPVVGIDLGTTNSEVAILENTGPRVLAVEGELIMPSCVGLDRNGELIVGRSARNQMAAFPEETILSIKRSMGREDRFTLGGNAYSPEEISSFILGKLKQQAEARLGQAVNRAVITVPAYFDDKQRKATRNAGLLAGLDVLRIVNEPTAASLAYDAKLENDQTVLVYDLGGGTFDASLVVVEKGVVEVKASHGDTRLGGDDFDRLLMEDVAARFKEAHKEALPDDPRIRNRLWAAVERAKRELSDAPYARIREEYIHGDLHLDVEISRMEFEELIRPLIRKTMQSVHKCLSDASVLPNGLDRVILVGGSTRIPLVTETILQDLRIEPHHEIHPDLIVAMGAAIQAGAMIGRTTRSVLVDITPYTFGTRAVSLDEGIFNADSFVPIIKRNTPLPASKGEVFSTIMNNQEAVDVRIYQGEAPLVSDNIFIGNFMVEGLSKVPAGNDIILNLSLDLNGILEVTAQEKLSGLSKTVRMETQGVETGFDPAGIRRDMSSLLAGEGDHMASEVSEDGRQVLADAKELRRRARDLLAQVDDVDAEELKSLIEESRKAVVDGDREKLTGLNESLSDMLFYLED